MEDSFLLENPILYSSRVHKDVFKTFNGPLGYIKSSIGGTFSYWIEKKLKLDKNLFKFPRLLKRYAKMSLSI